MSDKPSQFIRKYKRQSKSPWSSDDSTILLYANLVSADGDDIKLSFEEYIYLHRNCVGEVLGVSVSNSILEFYDEFDSQYLMGFEMYALLLMYIEPITEFCSVFATEFEHIFLLDPKSYFTAAESRWLELLENA
ncbi:hypothetical protein SOPP22_16425 [Shewanella sp. OPT22]|nr:hypothetical protein SOPP22_16425 [Shewanella sp. OPT22]